MLVCALNILTYLLLRVIVIHTWICNRMRNLQSTSVCSPIWFLLITLSSRHQESRQRKKEEGCKTGERNSKCFEYNGSNYIQNICQVWESVMIFLFLLYGYNSTCSDWLLSRQAFLIVKVVSLSKKLFFYHFLFQLHDQVCFVSVKMTSNDLLRA